MSSSQGNMPRTRRQSTSIPLRHLTPKHKGNGPAVRDLRMADPALVPRPPVHRHALHVVALIAETLCRDVQRGIVVVVANTQPEVGEPRAQEEVDGLGDDGVEPEEVPDQPGIESAGVAVAGEAGRRGAVVLVDDLAGAENGFVLSAGR